MSRYWDLIARLDGYEVGTLVVYQGVVSLLDLKTDDCIVLGEDHLIEVLNGDEYVKVSLQECLDRKEQGTDNPLFAGLRARVKL